MAGVGAEPFAADHCANCFTPLDDTANSLFCTERCRNEAKDVRWMRRTIRDPSKMADPEVIRALKVRMAWILAGGYPTARLLTRATREAVRQRDSGLCQLCGAPGTDIDHITGSSNGMDNLQLLCESCHDAKTDAETRRAPLAMQLLAEAFMEARVRPEWPTRLADDETRWETVWRKLRSDRELRGVVFQDWTPATPAAGTPYSQPPDPPVH